MPEEERTVRDLIRRLTAEEERALDSAPTTSELRAYLSGELGESEKEKFREHLSKDRQAVRALIELAPDRAAGKDAGAALTPEQRRIDREAVRARLATDAENQALGVVEAVAVATVVAKLRRIRLMALVSSAAFLGLLGWYLGSSAVVGRGPEAVEVIADHFLRPVEGVVRGDDDLAQLQISRDQRDVYLSLTAIVVPVPEQVRLVIHAHDNPQRPIERSDLPTYGRFPLRLRLDADQLPRGRVRLALYAEPNADPIAEYLLEVKDD